MLNKIFSEEFLEAAITIVLTVGAGFATVKKVLSKYFQKPGSDISKYIEKNEIIHNKIVECRNEFDANRVQVVQFHNGDYYFTNQSILKFSISYEYTDSATIPIKDNYQNVLASRYPTFCSELLNLGYVKIEDMNNTTFQDIKYEMIMRGVTSYHAVKLTNNQGKMIGYLAISFTDGKDHAIDLAHFNSFASLISHLLGSSK